MLNKIVILALSVAAFSSCSTAYKSTQTPDDVYYSPTRPAPVYADRQETRDEIADNYNNNEEREIIMAIRDPRWRNFNDPFAYTIGYGNGFYNRNSFYNYYNPYSYGFNNSPYNHFYNNWNTFNYGYYYNPYFYPHPIYNPVITKFRPNVVTKPRMVNLDAYNGYNTPNQPRYNNTNRTINASRGYNNTNTGSRVGNAVRKVLTPATSSGRNNSDNNTRSYTPSSSNRSSSPGSSSSGSSSGSGGGGVSRPGRGG